MAIIPLLDRFRNRTAAFIHDLLMIPVAWLGAYWLRFNLSVVPDWYLGPAIALLPLMCVVQVAAFAYFGLYRGVWRFASLPDLIRIVKAVAIGVAFCALASFLLTRMQDIPRAVFPLHAVLLLTLLAGPRIVYRAFMEHEALRAAQKKALVVGAGWAGETLARGLLRDSALGFVPVAFVDDDAAKVGGEIQGIRVYGKCRDIASLVERLDIDLILLAMPSANARQMRRVVNFCTEAGVPMRTLPPVGDLVSGSGSAHELREISIEDLLGRDPVSLDWHAIREELAGKVVLVTGGGGSIGSELCRQITRLQPRRLIIFDHGEFNLYQIEAEFAGAGSAIEVVAVLGDVCDPVAIGHAFDTYKPDVVFHAAAYKHVPVLEVQMREAVRNNVLGTRNTARAAIESGCETFVLISSDKAVNPVNVMGASKRIAEMLCQDLDHHSESTRFITVRFGNVLNSTGSVVPLFEKQLAAGGPITVTHADVERFFMTIPEAVQLIMQAAALGRGGEVFVLDMGEPIKISSLARQMIALAGKVPDVDIEIEYIGLRPGEKLSEELFHAHEALTRSPHEKLLLARVGDIDWVAFKASINALEEGCQQFDETLLRDELTKLIPRFRPYERRHHDEQNVIPMEIVKR